MSMTVRILKLSEMSIFPQIKKRKINVKIRGNRKSSPESEILISMEFTREERTGQVRGGSFEQSSMPNCQSFIDFLRLHKSNQTHDMQATPKYAKDKGNLTRGEYIHVILSNLPRHVQWTSELASTEVDIPSSLRR
jgi:hypothetical protein